jgi:hypothetical protein
MFGYGVVLELSAKCQKDSPNDCQCNGYGAGELWFEQLLS